MERAVFYGAIVVAVVFALGALIDSPHVHIRGVADFGRDADPVIEASAEQVDERVFAAGESSVRHAAVRLVVIPEAREDFAVEIDNPGRLPTPTISLENGRLVIEGRLRGRVRDCGDVVEVRGYGDIPAEELPLVRMRTPMRVDVNVQSAGPTEIGAAQEVQGAFSGCGHVSIGDVTEGLKIEIAGAGELVAGAAGSLDLDSAGVADASIGAVRDGANVSMAGAGDVVIASMGGALDASSAGAGELEVRGGAITRADISLAGAGSVRIAAPIETLDVAIVGVGQVDVDAVVGELDAEIAGPGGVRVNQVTGSVHQRVMGPGNVRIGR